MAAGDNTIFDEFKLDLCNGVHNFGSDTFRCGFINNTTVPTAGTATPAWGDFTQTSGGNFPATPDTVTVSISETAGTVTVDLTTNLSYASNASNPTDVYYAVVYNDTAAGDPAVCFIEIDAAGADGTAGLISLTWGADLFQLS